MPDLILYGVAESIINRLASLAFREIGLIYGVKDELEKLKNTLDSIKAMLLDAEQKREQDHAVKNWLSRFKEVLHDADDLLDDFVIEDLRHKVDDRGKIVREVGDFFSSSNQIAFRYKMARKIEEIRKQFNNVAEDMCKLNLNQRVVIIKQNEYDKRETSSFVIKSDIIGRDGSKKEIIDLLQTPSTQNVSLIAIVGFGGLGKTVLAQLVYNDAEVMKLFKKRIWVCVSEDFEVKSVVRKILESITKSRVADQQLEVLQNKLQESLIDQKYLLVLDDVWNESHERWNHLRNYLMCGAPGSKILVTTRSKMVAETMGINTPHVLKGLTEENSWALFKKMAFKESTIVVNPNLISVAQKIAKKCGGIPLVIRTMGSLLQSKTDESEWLAILDSDLWNNDSIMPVLKLSYDNLPIRVRQCFAYCCLYPKDWRIKKVELIQLWMAQGYLDCATEKQHMEDIGNQYVDVLLMRSFFQDVEINLYGDIEYFKLHDLMHDLAQLVAGTDCCLLGEGDRTVGRPVHVSFGCDVVCSLESLDTSRLRTFLRPRGIIPSPPIKMLSIISNVRSLRVLDLSYVSMTKLPNTVGELKHLRYLDLSYCHSLTKLPKTIGNLVNLQTLKLHHCTNLEVLPKGIRKLINLRHIHIFLCKAFRYMMPSGLGHWTSLQYLQKFVVGDNMKGHSAKLNELKDLNSLRGELDIINLHLVGNVPLESKEVNLKEKKYLQSLHLEWDNLHEINLEQWGNKNSDSLQLLDNLHPHENLYKLTVRRYPGVRFSSWLPSLTNIVEISLEMFENCQLLPPVEKLPSLKSLKIQHMYALEYMYYESCEEISPTASSSLAMHTTTFFPSLEKLRLRNCPKLRGWKRMPNVTGTKHIVHILPPFPHLSKLEIFNCPNLTCMPTYPHLVEGLTLHFCSMMPLMDTLKVNMMSVTEDNSHDTKAYLSSSSAPLSTLKSMEIGNVGIEILPEEWMQNLTSLEHLRLNRCPSLAPVFRHICHLPSGVQHLEIFNAESLDLGTDYDNVSTQYQDLKGLHSVQTIFIRCCNNLNALPEWICHLPSLKDIKIWDCCHLESLPHELCRLTNLERLRILMCPLLSERCKRETGADWPHIAHIPNIYDDFHKI